MHTAEDLKRPFP